MTNLINAYMSECMFLIKTKAPDGMGGMINVWTDGAKFEAAIGKDNTTAGRVAEQEGVTAIYTVTVKKNIMLEPFDVFRRLSDGKVFRVMSSIVDNVTPPSSGMNIGQVSAEEYIPV